VVAHPLFKMFLAYDYAWWQDEKALGSFSGRATTDMPIRQVYYYVPEAGARSSAGQQRAVIMASYSDEHYVDFWKPLLRVPGTPVYRRDGDKFDDKEEAVLGAWGVAEPMLSKAHRQITCLHPELSASPDGIPMPYAGIVRDWSEPPFYGGWHSWNPHFRSWEIVRQLVQPFSSIPLFTCGEAFSTEQGWIEGALKSAELVLQKMGIPATDMAPGLYETVRCEGYEDYIQS
jgi:monoamine oxidase